MAVTRVIGANGSPVEAPGAAELNGMMEQMERRIKELKVTPGMLQGFSRSVTELLDADSQQEMRDAAGIGAEKIAVKGDPGESPMLTVADDKLQYRLPSQQEWTELFNLDSLRPAPAKDGEPGINGKDGTNIESVDIGYQLSDSGAEPPASNWRSEPLSAVKGSYLWVRVAIRISDGTERLAYLVAYSGVDGLPGQSIKGEPGISIEGPSGKNGIDGREFKIRVDGGYLQYQYTGDSVWKNLLALSSLQGQPGAPGKDGVNATTTANATATTAGLMSPDDKSKLDGVSQPSIKAIASGGRPVGTGFTISTTRNAFATYTFSYQLAATLVLGQTITITATVDGAEVARMTDGLLLGLAGTLQKTKSVSFMVPAGKEVKFTRTGTSGITATVISGQETLL